MKSGKNEIRRRRLHYAMLYSAIDCRYSDRTNTVLIIDVCRDQQWPASICSLTVHSHSVHLVGIIIIIIISL